VRIDWLGSTNVRTTESRVSATIMRHKKGIFLEVLMEMILGADTP